LFGDPDYKFTTNEIFLNVGTRIKLSKYFNLLYSIGNNFLVHKNTENEFISYLALQLEL